MKLQIWALSLGIVLLGCDGEGVKVQEQSLIIVSHGGTYSRTQKKYSVDPYIKKTGVTILMDDYSGGIGELKTQVSSGKVTWDVIDLEWVDLDTACNEGLLEELPHDQIIQSGKDGTPAREDFIPEALQNKCGIGTLVWSVVMAYQEGNFPAGKEPTKIQDFFDLENFPGKRALKRRPQVNLEWALLADGVPKEELYQVLGTPEGVQRAFKKLNTIKNHTIWFESWSQGPQLLISQDAKLIQSANGRIYYAIKYDNQKFKIIWDGHSYDLDAWAIPKGSPKKELAFDFISFATQTEPLSGMPIEMAYGATRKTSASMYDKSYTKDLPTTYLDQGFQASSSFWAHKQENLTEQFNAWLLEK